MKIQSILKYYIDTKISYYMKSLKVTTSDNNRLVEGYNYFIELNGFFNILDFINKTIDNINTKDLIVLDTGVIHEDIQKEINRVYTFCKIHKVYVNIYNKMLNIIIKKLLYLSLV